MKEVYLQSRANSCTIMKCLELELMESLICNTNDKFNHVASKFTFISKLIMNYIFKIMIIKAQNGLS